MKNATLKRTLSPAQVTQLFDTLQARFEQNMNRHPSIKWTSVRLRLEANPEKLWSLQSMEATGGEPDVIGHDQTIGSYIFMDCSSESPEGRTSVCYDRKGLESRKEHRPKDTAMDMAAAMGVELLNEVHYRALQKLGEFDTKSSSWILTPDSIRQLGGALFCDRRYGQVFVYHNGAQSYYSGRGFRCRLMV